MFYINAEQIVIMMQQWRLIENLKCLEPKRAMAIEEAIKRTVQCGFAPNTLRIWRSNNAVVLGRHQCPKVEINFDSCLKYGMRVVRRFTGGGAVYHDCGNLNFSISINREKTEVVNLYNMFEKVLSAFARNLEDLGLSSLPKQRSIEVDHKKICGVAGEITKNMVFIHGSLLVKSNIEILCKVLKLNGERMGRFVPSNVKEVTTIERELGRKVKFSEIIFSLKKTVEEEFDANLSEERLTNEEYKTAKKLYEEKYSKPWWLLSTCLKCPEFDNDKNIVKILQEKLL